MDEVFAFIPYLQRFYGGDPERWFHMESWMLELYITELPRVQAREALWQVRNIALGAGTIRKEERWRQTHLLLRDAGQRTLRSQSKQEYEGQVALLGIPVRHVS